MRKTLITYVKPHVQEDPLAMVLGIGYIGAALERAQVPVELCDERIVNDQYMREAIERNDLIGFDALTPNIRRAIAWAKYAKSKGKITIMGGPHASVDQGIFLDSGHFDYVLKGEAEETLPQFLKALDGDDEAAHLYEDAADELRRGPKDAFRLARSFGVAHRHHGVVECVLQHRQHLNCTSGSRARRRSLGSIGGTGGDRTVARCRASDRNGGNPSSDRSLSSDSFDYLDLEVIFHELDTFRPRHAVSIRNGPGLTRAPRDETHSENT